MKLINKECKLKVDGDYLLIADFKERTVRTVCGDFYYDYDISFDDFFRFAKQIEAIDIIQKENS